MIKKLALALVLGIVYGVLNYLTIGLSLPGSAAIVSIRPQIVIPMLGGFLMGPLYGFIIGFCGNFLGDWLCGVALTYWTFSVGNGIMGAVIGLPRVWGGRRIDKIETVSDFSTLLLLIIAANAIGIGIGLISYNLICKDSMNHLTWLFFQPIIISNTIMSYMLVPPALFLFKKMRATFDIRLCISLLYLIIVIIISIIFIVNIADYKIIYSKLEPLITAEEINKTMKDIFMNVYRFGGTLGILVIVASISLAFILIQKLLQPVYKLMEAAKKLKEGKIDEINIKDIAGNKDALGKLAQVFDEAVNNVRIREEKLKSEIEKLQVVINKEQEDKQVKEITETEYFRNLKEKSQNLRAGRDKKTI